MIFTKKISNGGRLGSNKKPNIRKVDSIEFTKNNSFLRPNGNKIEAISNDNLLIRTLNKSQLT